MINDDFQQECNSFVYIFMLTLALSFADGQEACYAALEYSRIMTAELCNQSHVDKSSACLHKWPYVHSKFCKITFMFQIFLVHYLYY